MACVLAALTMSAQENPNDVTETRSDEMYCDGMMWVFCGSYNVVSCKLEGSKVVNGKTYGLLHVHSDLYGARGTEASVSNPYNSTIGIRYEDGRLYVNKEDYLELFTPEYIWRTIGDGNNLPYETTEDGELVLYDFSKNVGDTYCQLADGTTLTVTKTGVMKTEDGVTRRLLTLSNGLELIEGIGCTNSRGLMLFWLNISPSYHDYIGTFTYFGKKLADGTYEAILAYDFETVANLRRGITNKMLTKGRRWVYDYDNGQMKGTLTYSIEGDTLLHAYHRAKLCMTLVDNETNKVVRSGYVGAFHQLNEYLCYQAAGSNEDVFLYRFASNKGYFERNGIARYVVNKDDIVVNDNTYHRLLLLNYANGQLPLDKDSLYYWVEGIGSSKGLLEQWSGVLADSIQFVACYDGETCIFTNDDFYKDSGQLLEFSTELQKGPLWYFVDLSTKTASVSGSENCKSLSSIDILPSVELWGINCTVDKIADYAFKGLTRLESIIIPESVKEIGQDAFMDCTRLTSITFPDGLREIGYQSFRDCTRLTSITFPEGLKEIGYQAFRGCTGITSISWPSSLEVIGRASFAECNGLTSVILPEGITTIGRWAFEKCINLKLVDIPASVTSMDHNVFDYCESLKDVYCRPVTPPYNGQRLFYNANPDATLHVPAASLQVYKETAPWCDFKTIVPIETQMAYRPLVEEGKHWTYDNFLSGRPAEYNHYYYYELKGDTLIAGKKCMKMYIENRAKNNKTFYYAALYEENKKVYCFESGKDKAKLLYDFDCKVGDTLHVSEGRMVVKDIRTEDNGGISIRKYILQTVEDNLRVCWIEGVGCILDFFGMLPLPGNYNSLNACELNGEKLYQWIEPDYTAKGYHKMGIEGKRWNYIHYYVDEYGEHRDPYSYVVKGDTVINRTTYKKLWYQDEKSERLVCLLHESGRTISKNYDFGNNSYGEVYLSAFFWFDREDFGRVFTWKSKVRSGNTNWMVYGVDTINVNNRPFRRYTCLQKYSDEGKELSTIAYGGEGVWHDIWVEGVGSATSGIEDQVPSHEPPMRQPNDYTYFVSCYEDGECIFTAEDFNAQNKPVIDMAYRPFVEEGKVWKVGDVLSGNPVQLVEYYYFDGDTIIGGKTCIKMMCQRYVNPDHAESHFIIQSHSISYVGAWYEEGKKVYVYDSINNQFNLMYDFSVNTNDTVQIRDCLYVVGPKQIGGIKGFKGVYENIRRCEDGTTSYSPTWMESVGSIDGPTKNVYYVDEAPMWFLMSCTVGDEVIYFNDGYEDGATPEEMNARKQRIDFTHTIKIRPKSRMARESEAKSLYGEYNSQQLGISLNALDEAYQVSITDEAGKAVYEKAVNAGNVVGLNVDISAYAKGRYTVTVENSNESFTGQFETQTTGISLTPALFRREGAIYNLQGQRINALRKGLNIVDGRKVYVK